MSERERVSAGDVLRGAIAEDRRLTIESDRQLISNADPLTPVTILKHRGQGVIALSDTLSNGNVTGATDALVTDVAAVSDAIGSCLEDTTKQSLQDEALRQLDGLLSPIVVFGEKRKRGNRLALLQEKHFPAETS
jgi:hypothetical protein